MPYVYIAVTYDGISKSAIGRRSIQVISKFYSNVTATLPVIL